MDPKIWGPHGWKFLHAIAETYPDDPSMETKRDYYLFLSQLPKVLPCQSCRKNLTNHLKSRPLDAKALSSRRLLKMWLNDIHNMANVSLGKKIMTLDEADEALYRKDVVKIMERDPLNFYLIILVIILAAIFFVYLNKCRS